MKTPQEITKSLYDKSISFLEKTNKEIFIGGILAGIFVSLAAITSVTVCSDMNSYFGQGFTKLIFGIVFSLGLIIIVLSGSELFTGSNLYIVPIYEEKRYIKKLLTNWILVYISNFIGCLILIFFIIHTGVFNEKSISVYMINITKAKLNLTMSQAFTRGILCNFLVCLAVRVGEASDEVSGKIMGFIYVIGAFVINGFEHSIANMFFIPVGILLGANEGIYFSWKDFFVGNLLPVTLGNIIGGAFCVGTIYYLIHYRYLEKKRKGNKSKDNRSDKYGNFTA
ncbi:formate/nitrite transporter family protein [Clostridium ganghwense]|uniref:Formate/nitrite transporter family protein n=1 Tax=Clostridium ganghwense TaxID=312089 RepID=A0ABT4CP17_9CLOT|nr:formate/nitrite transporter family protein [Clostridium ganghwense]MCY6369719.1 formate/nitrite transporter family protein [Clostridium ganghwense]